MSLFEEKPTLQFSLFCYMLYPFTCNDDGSLKAFAVATVLWLLIGFVAFESVAGFME